MCYTYGNFKHYLYRYIIEHNNISITQQFIKQKQLDVTDVICRDHITDRQYNLN